MKKNRKILIVLAIVSLIVIYFCYKIFCIKKYSIGELNTKNAVIADTWDIKREPKNKELLILDNIRIRDDFKEFKIEKSNNTYTLTNTIDGQKVGFKIIEYTTHIAGFNNQFDILNTSINKNDIEKFIIKNNFENDVEFMKYIINYKEKKPSIFMSINEIKMNYVAKFLANNVLPKDSIFHELEGKHLGYAIENSKNVEVNILDRSRRYILSFQKSDYFTEDYIKELLGTIEIIYSKKED